MWWLLIFPIVIPGVTAYVMRWLDKTETRRGINRMADESRREDAYGAMRLY